MRHLFVYGTLLPDVTGELGTEERARLALEARWLGAASARGVLYDLGAYPGFVDEAGIVHGGVYELADPAATFVWLDAYEGVGGMPDDHYDRLPWQATLAAGPVIDAWAYVMRVAPPHARGVPAGRWIRHS